MPRFEPSFEWPWVLLLLVAVPLIARHAGRARRHGTPALGFNRVCAGLPQSRREAVVRSDE